MATEKDLEDVLAKYPELVDDGLQLISRQSVVYGRRIDLLFEDQQGRRLLVELKWGPLKDKHIGQLLAYEGSLVSADNPDIRIMLVGTRVPPNIARALDHHGIAWKEITSTQIATFLRACGAVEQAKLFEETSALSGPRLRSKALQTPAPTDGLHAALLAVVDSKWLEQARDELQEGKPEIYFGSNSSGVGPSLHLPINHVYFKAKGKTEVIASASFLGATKENIPSKRLRGVENQVWRYYYGFRDLKDLPHSIPLSELRHLKGGRVPNDVPGSCVILDPFPSD